jgi:hypothetical protein
VCAAPDGTYDTMGSVSTTRPNGFYNAGEWFGSFLCADGQFVCAFQLRVRLRVRPLIVLLLFCARAPAPERILGFARASPPRPVPCSALRDRFARMPLCCAVFQRHRRRNEHSGTSASQRQPFSTGQTYL